MSIADTMGRVEQDGSTHYTYVRNVGEDPSVRAFEQGMVLALRWLRTTAAHDGAVLDLLTFQIQVELEHGDVVLRARGRGIEP